MSRRPLSRSPRLTVHWRLSLVPRLQCLGPQLPRIQPIRIGTRRSIDLSEFAPAANPLLLRIASFPLDRQASIRPSGEFRGPESPNDSARPRQTGRQFEADPFTGPTGARKPFGGSVSHSRSGSGPSGSVLFPIPTQLNGFRLLSVLDVDPQEPVHFTSFPSGSTARTVTGVVRREGVRVALTRVAYPGDRLFPLFLLRLPAQNLLIYGPVRDPDGCGGARRRQLHFRRHDDLPVLMVVDRRGLIASKSESNHRTDNRTQSLPERRLAIVARQGGPTDQTGAKPTSTRPPPTANQSPSPTPCPPRS